MGRQQLRLLVCSATAIALLAGALFVVPWFRIDLMGSEIEIDLHSVSVCSAQSVCASVPLSKLHGLYPATATVSFYAGLLLLLVVIVQSASKIVTGAVHDKITRIGYIVAVATIVCGFSAGYLFGPDGAGIAQAIAQLSVERTWAPFAFFIGTLASFAALYYAASDLTEDVATYKPIQIEKRITPLTTNAVTRPSGSIPLEGSTRRNEDFRSKTPTGGSRIDDLRSPPLSPPTRSLTPGGSFARTNPQGRSLTPGGSFARTDTTPTTGFGRESSTFGGETRTRPPTQPPFARTEDTRNPRPPTQPPFVRIDETRTKTPSDPARTKTSSQQPFVARTTSPSGIAELSRTKTSSQPPFVARTTSPSGIDPVVRARTSSSGPIDLAARLSASVPNPLDGAPNLAVSIRPPLPTPEPVPPDQIPVDPAAGLTIRKRTASAAPHSEMTLTPVTGMPVAPAPVDSGMPAISVAGLENLAEALATPPPGHELPDYIRGKIKFAVLTAELASAGIKARREDGLEKLVKWDEVVGIVARRLPADKPFEGATVVDLLSSAGATLRIVPWTKLDGHPFEAKAVERARSFVNVVAAMALDAKLDAATKTFANGDGDAAQLPNVAALATYDSKVG